MSLDISEMMDGELDDAAAGRVLTKLREDEQARRAWEQYHVIGDALRGTTGISMRGPGGPRYSHELQQRVFAALAQEPTVLSPPVARARPARWQRFSVALAATVAAFGLYSWFAPHGGGDGQQIALKDRAHIASPDAMTRGLGTTGLAQVSADPAFAGDGAQDPYLAAHFEVTPAIRPGIMHAAWQPSSQR